MLVVMTDLINTAPILGGAFIVPEGNRFLHNQRLGLVQITDSERIDAKFLYFLLQSHDYRGQVRGSASGATVRHTSPGRIKTCNVRIPHDRKVQVRVGETLAAYDELMENNRRRMALLEAASRQLYAEWFVRLRYPSHARTRRADALPKCWEQMKFEDALVLQRGFDLPVQDREDGDVPIYGSTGTCGLHSKAAVKGPGVVTGRSGSLGIVSYVPHDYWPLNTALWVREFKRVSPLYAL